MTENNENNNEEVLASNPLEGAEAFVSASVNLVTDLGEIEKALEALIFVSPEPLSLLKIKKILASTGYETETTKDVLETLIQKYENTGFQLVKVAGAYQFRSHPGQKDILLKLIEEKPVKLSKSAMEVLTIVAYKQPVTRADIDNVRGTDSGHLLKGLLEKNLVRPAGHKEAPGRPMLYSTTPEFLEVFSMGSLEDLPTIENFDKEFNDDNSDALLLNADPEGFGALGSYPDRGGFDTPAEDVVESPDFGLEERAKEELHG